MWRITGFQIAITLFFAGSISADCDLAKMNECAPYFSQISPERIFSKRGQDAVVICSGARDLKACLSVFSSCSEDGQLLLDVVKLITDTVAPICKDDNSMRIFGNVSTCYQENFDYIGPCYDIIRYVRSEEMYSVKQCRKAEIWGKCLVQRIGEKCSEEEADFVSEILTVFEKLVNQHCIPKVTIISK